MTSAISALTTVYEKRAIPSSGDLPIIGVTSNTAPWELLRAAGFQPILLSPRHEQTPRADRHMEDAFSPRIKAIFDFLVSPEAAALSAVLIPRTSEQEHKLYLYLREVMRQGLETAPPPILYNLLQARSPEAQAYGLERTRELKQQLERMTGRAIEAEAMTAAIAEGNAARSVVRGLLRLRECPGPRLAGSEALALIGAWYFMDRTEYRQLARTALQEIETRGPITGPRVLMKEPPLGSRDICSMIEAQGAIVVAEDDWWGSRAVSDDIDVTADPLGAIFERYYFDAPSPRVFPSSTADAWFRQKAQEVDGVVFYLPEEDDTLGWDYPRLRNFLDERAIPHLMLRTASSERAGAFVKGLGHG